MWRISEVAKRGETVNLLPSGSVVTIHHPPPSFYIMEPLAQLVEHLTFNQGVEGSSPSWLTIF